MGFYVTLDADDVANDLWANHAATVGNTDQETIKGARVANHT